MKFKVLKHKRRLFALSVLCLIFLPAGLTYDRAPLYARPSSAEFPLEVDHVLIWVTKGAPEAKLLEQAGLQLQGDAHVHTGQGTASKTFVFENAYLELIWIDDEQVAARNAARSGIDMTTRARWRQTGASPFGVGLHRRPGTANAIPFPVKDYWAEWMKPNTVIDFAQSVSNLSEPMYFVVPEYISVANPAMRGALEKRAKHPLQVSRFSNLSIVTTGNKLTATSASLARGGILRIKRGKAPLVQLTFDHGGQGKSLDLRPQLPLILKY